MNDSEHLVYHERGNARDLLLTLLENVPEGITVLGGPPDFPVLLKSRYGEEFACRPAFLGQCAEMNGILRADGSRPGVEEMPLYRATRRGEVIMHEEWLIQTPDGRQTTVLVNTRPIRNSDGEIVGAINCWRDISELKQAESAVRQSEERFRSLVSVITDVPWVRDATGAFTARQAAWEAYTGQSWEEHRGFGWLNALHPEDRDRIKELWLRGCRHETIYEARGRLWNISSRRWRHFTARAVPLRNPDGTVREWIGAYRDTDDQKCAEELLEQKVAERTASLRETTDNLNAFCHTVAHDLRAPLRAQHGFAELLIRQFGDVLGPQGRDYAYRIASAAERLDGLLNDLLLYSRLARENFKLGRVDLNEAIEYARNKLAQTIERRHATITVEPAHIAVLAHEPWLVLVLTNLLSNAIKYVREDRLPEIRVYCEIMGEFVRLWVTDNGMGIAPEYHEKVFGVFERLHGEGRFSGTGIGLAIVRKCIERMGGCVGLESEPNGGSRFWIQLRLVDS